MHYMISWMVLSAVISLKVISPSLAVGEEFRTQKQACSIAKKELNESKLLIAVGDDSEKLKSWSPDLLSRTILELKGPFLTFCKDELFEKRVLRLQKTYLEKLLDKNIEDKEVDKLFRGLLNLNDDFNLLKKKITENKIKIEKFEDLTNLYDTVEEFKEVVIVSESKVDFSLLKKIIKEVDEKAKRSLLFWDPSVLFKVLVTDHKGVAAFIPEIGILVLSQSLLEKDNVLNRFVILHELSHAAEISYYNRFREDWKKDFLKISGWKETKKGLSANVKMEERQNEDVISQLAKESDFPLGPDKRVWVVDGKKKLDGFVFEKSYTSSSERGDISEDISDTIAAFFVTPSRFCKGSEPFMPLKLKWVAKTFQTIVDAKHYDCSKISQELKRSTK